MSANFVKVFVKNLSNPKAQLHLEAAELKQTLLSILSTDGFSSGFALKLLSQRLFGPNTLSKLSIRKHVDLVKVLSARMEKE